MKRSNSARLNSKTSNIPKLQRSPSLNANNENQPVNTQCENEVPNRPQNLSWRDRVKHYSGGDNSRGLTPSEPTTPDMDDKSSVKSFGSCASFMSCDITTNQQGSDLSLTRHTSRGQHKKYVLHCQHHVQAQPEYLTPTQRKDRQIRHLKAELIHSKRAAEEKDVEIERLKSEVERLRIALTEARFSDLHLDSLLQDQPNLEVIEEQDNLSDDNCDKYEDNNQCMDKVFNPGSPHNDDHCLEDSGILTDLSECQGDNNCSLGRNLRDLAQDPAVADDSSKGCKSPESNVKLHNSENISKVAFQKLLAFYNRNDPNQFSKHKNEVISDEMEKRNITIKKSQSFSSKQRLSNAEESLLVEHQRQLNDLKHLHSIEYQEMKEKYNDRVENLLQKLSDANARFTVRKKSVDVDSATQLPKTTPCQYMELRPSLDCAQNRVRQLESQLEELKKEMSAQEEWHSQMYLKMYRKGQEAAKFEHADEVLEFAHKAPKRVSVPELLQQLHRTEHELDRTKQLYRCELYKQATKGNGDRHTEYTLKFLKDAMYYFLTEKDNKGHLQAIESILDFSDSERLAVSKALKMKRL